MLCSICANIEKSAINVVFAVMFIAFCFLFEAVWTIYNHEMIYYMSRLVVDGNMRTGVDGALSLDFLVSLLVL